MQSSPSLVTGLQHITLIVGHKIQVVSMISYALPIFSQSISTWCLDIPTKEPYVFLFLFLMKKICFLWFQPSEYFMGQSIIVVQCVLANIIFYFFILILFVLGIEPIVSHLSWVKKHYHFFVAGEYADLSGDNYIRNYDRAASPTTRPPTTELYRWNYNDLHCDWLLAEMKNVIHSLKLLRF